MLAGLLVNLVLHYRKKTEMQGIFVFCATIIEFVEAVREVNETAALPLN